MTAISRRNLLAGVTAVVIGPTAVAAHDGHDHGAATPDASPMPGMDPAHMATNSGTGAIYMSIANTGEESDVLQSATTDAARLVQLHTMKITDGVMQMQELPDGLELAAGETVVLDPDDLHIMLIDLQHDLTPGSTIDLTLTFEHAGEVTLVVPVQWEAPDDDDPVVIGSLSIEHAWARPAPMLTSGIEATPAATPAHAH
jgi:copper(I)-binding protein